LRVLFFGGGGFFLGVFWWWGSWVFFFGFFVLITKRFVRRKTLFLIFTVYASTFRFPIRKSSPCFSSLFRFHLFSGAAGGSSLQAARTTDTTLPFTLRPNVMVPRELFFFSRSSDKAGERDEFRPRRTVVFFTIYPFCST